MVRSTRFPPDSIKIKLGFRFFIEWGPSALTLSCEEGEGEGRNCSFTGSPGNFQSTSTAELGKAGESTRLHPKISREEQEFFQPRVYSASLKVRNFSTGPAPCHSNPNEEQRLNLSGLTCEQGPAVEHLFISNLGL